jgi:putative transposase
MLPTNPSIGSSWPRTLSIAWSGLSPKSGVGRKPHLRLTYVAVVLDLYSRRVIGWAVGHHLTVDLAEHALTIALSHRPPTDGLLHHSDRSSQYAATSYQRLLNAHGITASMSRTGNCWDNACVESFFVTLKRELVYPGQYCTRDEARQDIVEYIEVFSNWLRRHSTLGYHSPASSRRGRL